MLSSVGPLEVVIVLVVALLVFGPKRLPELGASLGQGIRGFGRGLREADDAEAPDNSDSGSADPIRAVAPGVATGVREYPSEVDSERPVERTMPITPPGRTAPR